MEKKKTAIVIISVIAGLMCLSCCCCSSLFFIGSKNERTDENSSKAIVETTIATTTVTTTAETTPTAETTETTVTESQTTAESTTTVETTTATSPETTGENDSEIELSQLYMDFFKPYTDSVGKLMPYGFQQNQNDKLSKYYVTIQEGNEEDMWRCEIKDQNGDAVNLWFYPSNVDDDPSEWIETLNLLTYNRGDKEISITDDFHLLITPEYRTYDKNRENKNETVTNVSDLELFMFK